MATRRTTSSALGEDRYRVTVVVAGFTGDELNVEAREHSLLVEGRKKEAETSRSFLTGGSLAAPSSGSSSLPITSGSPARPWATGCW